MSSRKRSRDDIRVEVSRLTALGARPVSDNPCSERGSTWILMTDPAGNDFCICDNGAPANTADVQ